VSGEFRWFRFVQVFFSFALTFVGAPLLLLALPFFRQPSRPVLHLRIFAFPGVLVSSGRRVDFRGNAAFLRFQHVREFPLRDPECLPVPGSSYFAHAVLRRWHCLCRVM
jgi:hypothetical protein